MKTLQEYLESAIRNGSLNHTLSVVYQAEDDLNVGFTGIGFILHPADRDGETLSFVVRRNQLYSAEFPQVDGTIHIDYGLAVAQASDLTMSDESIKYRPWKPNPCEQCGYYDRWTLVKCGECGWDSNKEAAKGESE